MSSEDPFLVARHKMVVSQLKQRGIRDRRVLEAFQRVPRHLYVPGASRGESYRDGPLPIGHQQTISQPYIVARMTEALGLDSRHRVLEVGTGSGYQTAILAELAGLVHTVERIGPLAQRARLLLHQQGYDNLRFRVGDGSVGWPEAGPFDAIIVTAAAPKVPESLVDQLAEGGTLVVPAGPRKLQSLYAVDKRAGKIEKRVLCHCMFVQLAGEEGWGG